MHAGSTFIGRDTETAELECLLTSKVQLVTVTGPGGIGKTRLSTEMARRVRDNFGGGVLVVELASIEAGRGFDSAVLRLIGNTSIEAALVSADGRPQLIVLDNCEHVLDDARRLVLELVSHDEQVTVLATSRVPIKVPGEHVVPLAPLPLPIEPTSNDAVRSAAVQLFLERAQTLGAPWPPNPTNLQAVADIVRCLDGIPLAIELAAAQSRSISPGDLVGLLERQLDVLDGTDPDVPDRHRSIRHTIASSYEVLDSSQQLILRRLSRFRSSFDLDLASRVIGTGDPLPTLRALTGLLDHSLLTTAQAQSGKTVYRMLEPIRAFAGERLDVHHEQADADERFVTSICDFADEIVIAAFEQFSANVIDRIAENYAHLLQALNHCINQDESPDRTYRLFLPLYAPTGAPRTEVARLGTQILERWPAAEAPLRAEAIAVMAHASLFAGEIDEAVERAESAVSLPNGSALAKTVGHRVLAYAAAMSSDNHHASTHLDAAIDAAESVGGSFLRELKVSRAATVTDPKLTPGALRTLEHLAKEAADLDETVTLVWAAIASAHHHLRLQDSKAAAISAERAVDLAHRTATPWAMCAARRLQASICTTHEGWEVSLPVWRLAIEDVIAIGDVEGFALAVRTSAGAAEFAGASTVAAKLWRYVPMDRGISVLESPFAKHEQALLDRLGRPTPVGFAESVARVRQCLGLVHNRAVQPNLHDGFDPTPSPSTTSKRLFFGNFELDLAAHELRHNGSGVHIEPQVFDVLAYLATNAGRMVPRDELLDEVWGDRFVSPSALTSRIKSARAATGDDGRNQNVIRTVHGRGFTFVAQVDTTSAI